MTSDETTDRPHLQFCDADANQDITGSPTQERDATEVRAWSGNGDGTVLAAVSQDCDGTWHVSGSDVNVYWTGLADTGHRTWQDAMHAAGIDPDECE